MSGFGRRRSLGRRRSPSPGRRNNRSFARRVQSVVEQAERNDARVARYQLQLNAMAGNAYSNDNIDALQRAYTRLQKIYNTTHNKLYNRASRAMLKRLA